MKTTKAIEREIADLEQAQLDALHAQAVADAAAAEANFAEFLDKGNLSGELDGAQTAVHIAKQNAIDLGRAIERQAKLIATTQEQLAETQDLAAREQAAVEREQGTRGKERKEMGAAESLQRDKLRQEYLANMREQINVFQGLGKDLSQIATKVEVMGVNHTNTQSALEKIEDDMHKVLENQTTPVGRRRL